MASISTGTDESSHDLIDAISRAELLASDTERRHYVFWRVFGVGEQYIISDEDRLDGELVYTSLVGS